MSKKKGHGASEWSLKFTGKWIAPDHLEPPAGKSDSPPPPGPLTSSREQKVKIHLATSHSHCAKTLIKYSSVVSDVAVHLAQLTGSFLFLTGLAWCRVRGI